uniref:CTNNB1_binding domain-containing protein n=1 Tax=Heterorhabditis bacteriophora TaxID=37862 RepID=A0A1I7XMP0_HETBA
MTDEGADEVKVFRRSDAEDLETNAQSSHQLAEDKKDVVLEAELESRPQGDSLIGSKSGAFVKPIPSPSFAGLASLQHAAFSPSYGSFPSVLMPWFMQMNQMRLPYVGSPITSMASSMANDGMRRTRDGKIKKVKLLKMLITVLQGIS